MTMTLSLVDQLTNVLINCIYITGYEKATCLIVLFLNAATVHMA